MKTKDARTQAEEVSQALVFVDPGDIGSISPVAASLDELADALRAEGRDREAAAVSAAAGFARSCLESGQILPTLLEAIGKAVEGLQLCLDGHATFEEVADILTIDGETTVGEGGDAEPGDGTTPPGLTVSTIVDEAIVSEFLARQTDAMPDVEKLIMALENAANDATAEELKRWFHTLKGESGLLGLTDVAELCHATEDMMQAEPLPVCIDRLLAVKDWMQSTFDYIAKSGPNPVPVAELLAALQETAPVVIAAADSATATPASDHLDLAAVNLPDYTDRSLLDGDVGLIQDFIGESNEHLDAAEAHLLTLDADPREAEALNAVFRGFHSIKGLAGFCELDHIKELAHKAENLLDMARKGEIDLAGGMMDLVFESVDLMKRLVEEVAKALAGNGYLTAEDRLPRLIVRLGAATSSEAIAAAPRRETPPAPPPEPAPLAAGTAGKSGFIPLANLKKKASPAAAPAQPAPVTSGPPRAAGANQGVKVKEAMRVDAERLDRLIDTIGELVIAESMVSQNPEVRHDMSVKLAKDLDHLDKISRELQEIGMSLRMVPVRPVFQKMARLVRDLAKKTDRHIEFVMSGEDTELDKNVVDKIGDPLVHMVRNAVDHGIEDSAAARRAAGKSEMGRIELRAFHKGGNIVIEIEDDGRGLNRERILQKAYERGLLREGDVPSDREIFNLIFEPGFSTAKQVTDISGRGVGMDVVRRNIEELRGTCEIQSLPGKGSVFSVKLPLTLAIIEGMVVSCAKEHYIIPTLSVVRLIRPQADDIFNIFDRGEMLAFADEHLPLFRLHRLFDLTTEHTDPTQAVVVVVEDEGRRIGLLADDLLGQQSIVIKSLGESMQTTEGVAGGAIMSNGTVALILDVAGLIRVAHANNTTGTGVGETSATAD